MLAELTDIPAAGLQAPAKRRLLPAVVLAFATGITAVWTVVAIRAAGRGLDLTDEGFYLLSYRWWNVDHRNFTGVQYLYGPVFALLGHDIAALRIFRLGTVLLAHLLFGLAFMRWLRPRRPAAPPTRLWEMAGAAVLVAAGGAIYSWLPLSPGYNDVVLLGTLLAMAVVFRMARDAERGARGPAWRPAAFGVVGVAMVLAKWASVLLLATMAVTAVVALAPSGVRAIRRAAVWAVAGVAATTAVMHFMVPLPTAVAPLMDVNHLLAEGSFSIPVLLHRYLVATRPTLETIVWQYGPLLLAALAAALARRRSAQVVAGLLGVAGLARAAGFTLHGSGLGGGPVNVAQFLVPLVATGLVAVLVVGAGRLENGRLEDGRGRLLLGGLAVLPLLQAFGSSNTPLKMSVMGFPLWMAVLVAAITGLSRRAVAARGLTVAVAAGSLLVTACVSTGGLWRNPYRDVPRARATVSVAGVPALAGLRLAPEQARKYSDLYARLAPYLTAPGRRVFGLDKMAGVVLLLDGRTVGEVWYPPEDPARTRAGIAAACAGGPPWPAGRAPIIVLNRPLKPADAGLLRPCGLELSRDYRPLAPAAETGGFTVLVPN